MTLLLQTTPFALLAGYVLLGIDYGLLFFTGRSPARRIGPILVWTLIAVHAAYLIGLGLRWGQFPAATISQAFSILAFAVLLIYAVLELWTGERSSGFWMVTQATTFQILSLLLWVPQPPHREAFESPLFGLHVLFALLGYASFAIAAGYGFLFLRLYRELKGGRFHTFFGRLPALEILERMLVGGLWVGFLSLTGGLVTGMVWVSRRSDGSWLSDPAILLTLVTWALYGGSLLMRRLGRWQGRQTARASLAGLAIILGSLVLARLLFRGDFHGAL